MNALSSQEFDLLSGYIRNETGICLTPDKAYLLEHRFAPLLSKFSCASYLDLHGHARANPTVARELIEAICTNETLFFRDQRPFKLLTDVLLPSISGMMTKIHSAACSTGQEAYSICIAAKEAGFPLNQIRVVGTDISSGVVEKAKLGVYSDFEVGRGLPEHLLGRYFERTDGGHRVSEELRRHVEFRTGNLLRPGDPNAQYDIVFCRNLACYFDVNVKQQLLEQIARSLKPGGYLVLGATERIEGIPSRFEPRDFDTYRYYQLG